MPGRLQRLPTSALGGPQLFLPRSLHVRSPNRSLPLAATGRPVVRARRARPAPATDGPGALWRLTSRARTAWARRATRPRRCGSRSPTACSATSTSRPTTTPTSRRCSTSSADGSSFTDLQTRDTTYTVAGDPRRPRADLPRDHDGQERALQDRHRLHGRPRRARPSSSARRFVALKGRLSDYRLYVRHDPTLNGNGGGGPPPPTAAPTRRTQAAGHTLLAGSDPVTTTNAANRDYAVPVSPRRSTSTRGFDQVDQRLRGRAQRRPRPARRRATRSPSSTTRPRSRATSCRPGASRSAIDGRLHARPRLRRYPGEVDHCQPRQRRPHARPALRDRRRLPRTRPPRRALGHRPRRDELAGGVVDAAIGKHTPSGWLRYNGDGYGDCQRGLGEDSSLRKKAQPWAPSDKGTGHIWPVLSAERGEQDLVTGSAVRSRSPAGRDRRDVVGRRPGTRAGLGLRSRRGVAIRHLPDDCLDRLRQRQTRRIRCAADLARRASSSA